jgi:hypothetical protein
MNKVLLILLFLYFPSVSFSDTLINADTLRIDGKLVLYLASDDDWQDGFNYGFLLGHRIKPLIENYLIPLTAGGVDRYNIARRLFDQHFIVDEKYIRLSQGIIEGMESSGINLFSTVLNDLLTYKDILILNAIPDFTAFSPEWYYSGPGCSNLTSWGAATSDAPELKGETVISRNLDWDNNIQLINNALIIIWATKDPSKQSFVTFGYPGLIGALSGINESGVATFQNMGNYFSYPEGTKFYPVNLAMRNGLEAKDYNRDGISSPRDIADAVISHNLSSTYIIHSAGPSSNQPAAEILEIHNSFGYRIRTRADNDEGFGDNLVATNHFRMLKPPEHCSRYKLISDSLLASNKLGIERNWNVLSMAGTSLTLQTIQFIPEQSKIRVSFAAEGNPSNRVEPTEILLSSLFNLVGINEKLTETKGKITVFPNPVKDRLNISLFGCEDFNIEGHILDMEGKIIKYFQVMENYLPFYEIEFGTTGRPSGIYFLQARFTNRRTKEISVETHRFVITK